MWERPSGREHATAVDEQPTKRLTALLAPYADAGAGQTGRLLDLPPAVAKAALALLPEELRAARLNLCQPPMSWLVAVADDLAGRLVGVFEPERLFVRFDGVQVPATAAGALAARIATEWPPTANAPGALQSAVAEGWPTWTATEPTWTGLGTDLLTGRLPPSVAVVGVWFD